MRIVVIACLFVSMAAGAWAAPSPASHKKPAPLPPPVCKPGAPVGINAVLDSGIAHVVVMFSHAVEAARIEVDGTDGLTVSGGAGPSGQFASGVVVRFDVRYSSPPGGYLVVTVDGTYGGQRATEVRSFRLPGGASAKPGVLQKDSGGQMIHVLPGQTTTR